MISPKERDIKTKLVLARTRWLVVASVVIFVESLVLAVLVALAIAYWPQ